MELSEENISRIFVQYLVLIGLLSNLVLPTISFGGKSLQASYVFSIISLLLITGLINKKFNKGIFKKVNKIFFILTSIVLTFLLSTVFLNDTVSFKYFIYEIAVYLVLLPLLFLISYAQIDSLKINNAVFFAFCVFVVVGVLQVFGFSGAVFLYAYERHAEVAMTGSRITVTGTDPNVGSIIGSFFALFYLAHFFIKKKVIYFILFLIAIGLIFKTQGRTTIIGMAAAISFYILFAYKVSITVKALTIIAISAIVIFLSSFFDLYYLIEGIQNLLEGKNNSFNVRLDNVAYGFRNFLESPIIGWGISKELYGEVRHMDSEIILILQRYGIIGALVVLGIMFYFFRVGFHYKNTAYGAFILLMICSLIFNMLTNAVFFGSQTPSLITFLLLLTYYLKNNEKNYLPPPTPSKS